MCDGDFKADHNTFVVIIVTQIMIKHQTDRYLTLAGCLPTSYVSACN